MIQDLRAMFTGGFERWAFQAEARHHADASAERIAADFMRSALERRDCK